MSDQTIKTLAQLLAEEPNNLSRLIRAGNMRNLTVSAFPALVNRDPGLDDDSVNSGGEGYFDAGNRWLNTVTGNYFVCRSGMAHAASWWRVGPNIIQAGTNVTVTFDGTMTWTIDATGGSSGAPLTLQPPTDPDYALALKQHSSTQSGPLLETLDSTGTQFGPRITGGGQLTNPGKASSGSGNELLGLGAGLSNVSGGNNTLIGSIAGGLLDVGSNNTMIGAAAGWLASAGSGDNTFVGEETGVLSGAKFKSTFVGQGSGYSTGNGQRNTGCGWHSLYGLTSGDSNTAVGEQSLSGAGSFALCTAIGSAAGVNNSGSNNTFVGATADMTGGPYSNSTAIGCGSQVGASNQIMMGTASETTHFPGPTSGIQYGDIAGAPSAPIASGGISGTTAPGPGWVTIATWTGPNALIGLARLFATSPGFPFVLNYRITLTDPINGTQVYTYTGGVVGNSVAFAVDVTSGSPLQGASGFGALNRLPFTTMVVDVQTTSGFSDCAYRLDFCIVQG
jgi:hypothetical protein